jgi:PPOX class probable F420-dependent enzyme
MTLTDPAGHASRYHLHDVIMSDDVSSLADEKFVSLTTWKKSGEKVTSAMWLARDGDALVMWTPADSWKVKRLRRDNRVELTPCGRTGKVDGDAKTTHGSAVVDADPAETARVKELIKTKYGFEFHVITFIERIAARGSKNRVVVRVTV